MKMLLLLLLWAPNIFAVTDFIVDVNCPGEDYNTIALAEDATDINLTATTTVVFTGSKTGAVGDLATVTQYRGGSATGVSATVAHANTNQILLYGVSAGAGYVVGDEWRVDASNYFTYASGVDSARVCINVHSDEGALTEFFSVAGGTVNATNYRCITVPVGDRHSGTAYTGAQLKVNGGIISVSEAYAVIEYLAVPQAVFDNLSAAYVFTMSGAFSTIRNCVIGNVSNPTSNNGGIRLNIASAIAHNNIIFNLDGAGVLFAVSFSDASIRNCTVTDATVGFSKGGTFTTFSATNCLALDCTTCFSGITVTTCGSSDLTGSTGLTGLSSANEFVSVALGSEDLHLKLGATSIDAGTDLGADYITDIDGDTRTGAWDLGADEYMAPAASDNYSGKGLGRGIGRGIYR